MKRNVGKTDRAIRAVIGLGLLAVGAYFHSGWGWIGLVPLATAVVGFCPAYLPFGLSTCAGCEQKN